MKKRELTEGDFKLMGLPKQHWGAFWSFIYNSEVKENIYNYLKSLNEDQKVFHDGDGLYLCGPSGSGKTYAAAVCAKAFRKYEYSVMFTTAKQFQKDCEDRKEFEEGVSVLDRAQSVDLLVIDDWGEEIPAFKGLNHIVEIVDFRRDWKKNLILSSKLTPVQIDEKMMKGDGTLEAKIHSFMFVVKCVGNFNAEKDLQEKYLGK